MRRKRGITTITKQPLKAIIMMKKENPKRKTFGQATTIHLPGNEYTEGDGQVQYDEYGGYYDEHGQYYDCHGGYYDEHGEYVYPENYQHEEYEQDGQGGYDHGDVHGAPQADHEENYEGKNQEPNDMYRKSEMNQSKYTPYKHGGKPAVSPLRSPFPRQDTHKNIKRANPVRIMMNRKSAMRKRAQQLDECEQCFNRTEASPDSYGQESHGKEISP